MCSEISFKTNTVAIVFQLHTEISSHTIHYYAERLSALQFKKPIESLDIKKYLLQLSNQCSLFKKKVNSLVHINPYTNPQNLWSQFWGCWWWRGLASLFCLLSFCCWVVCLLTCAETEPSFLRRDARDVCSQWTCS